MTVTGGCLCGAVRYEIAAAPMVARSCWCRVCQYLGAGTATMNVCFPSAAVRMTGTLAEYRSVADSGAHMVRGFCGTCGTPITSAADERPNLLLVRAGTLDDPELMAPQVAIWTARAPAWAPLDPAIPHYLGQLPPAA